MGIAVGQIIYLIDAPFYGLRRWEAFLFGLIALVVMAVGAKLLYLLENIPYVKEYGVGFFGFSLFGAVFILPLACFLIARIFRRDVRTVSSAVIVPSLVMLAFYRIDCTISGCCGGIVLGGVRVPTQLIECAFCALLALTFVVLERKDKLGRGVGFALFFVCYGAMRFVLEFFRERTNFFGPFALSHIWALIAVAAGIVMLVRMRRQHD